MAEPVDRARRGASPTRLAWPVVGRPEEDRAVALLVEHGVSVAVVGAAGTGKSVLAERVTDRVAGHVVPGLGPLRVVPITATRGGTEPSFAATIAHFGDLPADVLTDDARAEYDLRVAADLVDQDVVLRIDNADVLDPVSARYVAWLVRHAHARLVFTCRDFTALAEPLRRLWQDDLLERIDLAPFDRAETGSLLERVLGGALETASVERVYQATQGNPLYLREVVRAALTSGALQSSTCGWFWRGRVTASRGLEDMYRTELGRLPVRLRDVVELVALADPVPLAQLLDLVDDGDLDEVAARGLVTVDAVNATRVVRPSHPLIGEVVRRLVPVARRSRLFAHADAFRSEPPPDAPPDALLRATLWAVECGVRPTTSRLLEAAGVAVRLQEYDSAVALASSVLSGAETSTAVTVSALCLRVTALSVGVGREAARHDAERAAAIAATGSEVLDDALRLEATEMYANLRQFHDDDDDAAIALLDGVVALVGPEVRERIRILRLAHLGWAGRFTEVLAETDRAGVLGGPVPFAFLALAPCAVVALAVVGRVPEALALGQAALTTAARSIEQAPWSVGELTSVLHQVQMWTGHVEELVIDVDRVRASPFVKYEPTLELVVAGNIAVVERRWQDAHDAFAAACTRFAVADHGGFLAYPRARLALALAMLDRTSEAAVALDLAASTPGRGARITAEEIPATLAYTEMVLGRPVALDHAVEMVARSEAIGAWLPALFGLMLQLRLETDLGRDVATTTARIRRASVHVDSPVARAYLAQLDADERHDAERARQARAALATFGFPLGAARRGRPALTRREHEVAVLAVEGLSNRQIAEQLGLSVRTIDAHVARIFTKWDLHARQELDGLL